MGGDVGRRRWAATLGGGEVAANLATMSINIDAAKKHFERFIPRSGQP